MRILVVEDEKNLNRILAETLTDEGYSVDRCFNGQEALEYMGLRPVRRHNPGHSDA